MNWISFFICIFLTFSQITCSGLFELRLKSFRNDNGLNSLGRCCTDKQTASGSCQGNCQTRFKICLKQYQAEVDAISSCTFGSAATPILGENSFRLLTQQSTASKFALTSSRQKETSIDPIEFPFNFTWPGSFTLIVEAYHDANDSSSKSSTESLISRYSIQGELGVSANWTEFSSRTSTKEIEFEYRVTCQSTYYGGGCEILCRERDDNFGHYACSASGQRMCLSGWQGDYCSTPRCSIGCNADHGHCEKPNECKCKSGWRGSNCDECELYPGCIHGTCSKPFDCICKEGWGGLLCNQDLNFCTNHKPCHNGGFCSNTGQGSYTCKCLPGFTGTDCEIKVKNCSLNPCLNDATCVDDMSSNDGYTCQCRYGWIGKHCENQTVTCASKPCFNGGQCRDSSQGFKCECAAGFIGRHCETQMQNCNPNPCQNSGKCITLKGNQYKCQCPLGFDGANCEENIDDCQGANLCKNGGTCIDGINQYQCKCSIGYTGAHCEKHFDFCLAKPCANGGTCLSKTNGFICLCRSGFTGIDCNIDIDECQSAPCKNGATCINRVNSYECQCPDSYQGTNCDERNALSDEPSRLQHQASTSSYQEAQTGRSDNLSNSQIALIAILSVAVPFVAICGIAVVICMKRKRKREQEKDDAEARKQNEQNASHITHLHQHHHNAIVAVKRSTNSAAGISNGGLDSSTHHMIKNTWDKSVNNITNSISMDENCLLNTSMYGTMSNFSDNTSSSGGGGGGVSGVNTSQCLDGYQSQIVPQTLQRAKSQKQLNTDPAVMNRASLIMHRQSQIPTSSAKELCLDKRISVLAESTNGWSGNGSSTSRQLLDRCSPNHI